MTASGSTSRVDATHSNGVVARLTNRRTLVIGSRAALLMLLVAGVALLALGVATAMLVDPPEVNGWLRSTFGTVFAYMAVGMAAILAIPAAVGLWAIAGANAEAAVPALSRRVHLVAAGTAVATTVTSVVVVLATGSSVSIVELGLIGLVALMNLGLAGVVAFSPHRGRAALSAVALFLVAAGTIWVMVRVVVAAPR